MLLRALAIALAVALFAIAVPAVAQDAGLAAETATAADVIAEQTTPNDIYERIIDIYDARTLGVVALVEAILALLVGLLFFTPLRKALDMMPKGRFDSIPYGGVVVLLIYTGAIALAATTPWYIAAAMSIAGAVATPQFARFLKELQDPPGVE